MPAAAMFMLGYNWLSNQVSSRLLFHLTITPFLVFYAIFAFVMYPMRDVLHHPGGPVNMLPGRDFGGGEGGGGMEGPEDVE